MKPCTSQLSARENDLVDQCIGWHIRPHRQAWLAGLQSFAPSLCFEGQTVLELGADGRSSLSPFVVARGARATVTCYLAEDLPRLDQAIARTCARYGLPRERLVTKQADVFQLEPGATYDIVMLKGVLGGVNRRHELAEFGRAVAGCMAVLRPGGHLLIVDKGRTLAPIHWLLQRKGSAGRKAWHYFSRDELRRLAPSGASLAGYTAFGVASFGDFGGGRLQQVADALDERLLEPLVPTGKRAVFAATYVANGAEPKER